MDFRSAVKIVPITIFGIVLFPVISEFFVEYARQKGFYTNPEGFISILLSTISSLVNYWWYPWLSFGLLCFSLGVWIDWFIRFIDRRRQKKLLELSNRLIEFAERVSEKDITERDAYFLMAIASDIENELEAVGLDLRAHIKGEPYARFIGRVAAAYFRLAPSLKKGDLKAARSITAELNSLMDKKASKTSK